MLYRIVVLFIVFISVSPFSKAGVCDSIGVEKRDGKLFVLHRIEAKETLYSLSRRYGTSVEEIKKYNPETAQGLKLGQIVKIPVTAPTAATNASAGAKTHTIAAGETLYSISKKYGVSVEDLKKANPGLSSSVQLGQVLNIPVNGAQQTTTTNTTQNTNTATPSTKDVVEHKVASGETLYSIAKKYNVSVEDIKKANPGIASLKVGQVVKVPGATIAAAQTNTTNPTTTTPTNTTTTTTTTPTTTNTIEGDSVQLKQDKIRLETIQQTQPITPVKPIPASDFKKITESGFADLMPENQDSPKYLAYHKSAPVGTIIQLVNDVNGQKIYVRVVGKLNDYGPDYKTIIRISRKAYERLGGVNGGRLTVSLMYIP